MTLTQLPDTTPDDGRSGSRGGLDGGRIVRALAWARSGDSTRAVLIPARFGQITEAVPAAAAAGVPTPAGFAPASQRGAPHLRLGSQSPRRPAR